MIWRQVIDPLDNLIVSALVAIVPVLFIFWALIIKKMRGYQASLLAILIVLVIALLGVGDYIANIVVLSFKIWDH